MNEHNWWKIMSENSSICIKINSWLSTIELRQHSFFLSLISYRSIFSTADFFRSNEGFVDIPFYHRFHTDQHFNSWLPEINENFASTHSYHWFIQINIWSASSSLQQSPASTFDNWSIDHKFWSYEGFLMIFISKDIFTFFLHESKLDFIQFVLLFR